MTSTPPRNTAAVIGGGPAGLMAASILSKQGFSVDLFDGMASLGRKFLLAGIGGMNLTHSEPLPQFLSRYAPQEPQLLASIEQFSPNAIREWASNLGIATFVGTSGRVFPSDMKAAPLLRAWLRQLREQGVRIHTRHRWLGWAGDGTDILRFSHPEGERYHSAAITILALGGASWPRLGADGGWVPLLRARGVAIQDLEPANCGFNVDWSATLQEKWAGTPLKSVTAHFEDAHGQRRQRKGEFVLSKTGIEGSLIYALSAPLRETLNLNGSAALFIDLMPDQTLAQIAAKLARPRNKNSLSNHWRKAGIQPVHAALLREALSSEEAQQPQRVANALKALPIHLTSPRPIAEAISSAGGVEFSALNSGYMLNALPGVFCAGEMLHWEAPTGGYLLTGCLATGYAAGLGASRWLLGAS
ncbi:Predicted flavoprotein [gamma proteobacterium HdN1]|nr:Predicted flavoprotein [gamma proteobacterium HdN1]